MRPSPRIGLLLGGALLVASGTARAGGTPPVDPELIARRVAVNQRLVERRFSGATYDLLEVRTRFGKDGVPKETGRRLFYVLASENGGEGTRELVEVDDRPATPEEARDAADEDAKRRRRVEERAAKRASAPPAVSGDDDDPLVGDRRLSELLARYELTFVAEEVVEGRPVYVLDFAATQDEDAIYWDCVPGYLWWGWYWYWDPCAWLEPVPIQYTVGSVLVLLIDPNIAESPDYGRVVFGGLLQGVADGSGDAQQRIEEGVARMFDQYPTP